MKAIERWCRGLGMACLILGMAAGNALGVDYYVSPSGDGSDGSTWAKAFTNVQAGLDVATSGNDRLLMAGGQYVVTSQINWTTSGVGLYGGYEGAGSPGSRNTATWPTIISRSDLTTNRIFFISGVSSGVLDGVTVTNGFVYGPGNTLTSYGGGLQILNSPSLTLANCQILNNVIFNYQNDSFNLYGGGIYMQNSSVTVTNCAISANRVDAAGWYNVRWGSGGGVALNSGTCTIDDCLIIGNYARGDNANGRNHGGGLYLNGTATIRRSVIRLNDAQESWNNPGDCFDGAYVEGGTAFFQNCLIADNHGADSGVGFRQDGGTVWLDNCTVASNQNTGVSRSAGTLSISNSVIWANGDDISVGALLPVNCDIEDGDNVGNNGCISVDPMFADGVYYHPQSASGTYGGGYLSGGSFSAGTGYSPVIDAGSATAPFGNELQPNGGALNMGYDGNTAAASKSQPLSVTNLPATGVGNSFATLHATVPFIGTPGITVWFYFGTVNGNANPLLWETNFVAGTLSGTGSVAAAVTGLTADQLYYFTAFASNSVGVTVWASPSLSFTPTLSAPAVENRGVLNEAGPTVTLKGEITSTGGEDPLVYVCWGASAGGATTGSWEHVVALPAQTGTFQTDITTAPGGNYFYTCYAVNSAGGDWASPNLPFGANVIRYVAVGASGLGTGYNWDDAYPLLQTAINNCDNSKTNLIYVKGGVYPTSSSITWNKDHVFVTGGYEGTGTPGAHDPALWPTIRTNTGLARIIAISGSSDGRIQDITFTGGNPSGNGGAISMENATNMVVDTCVFLNNRTAVNGGAIYASGTENLTLRNCTLRGNMALNNSGGVNGGAIYASGVSGTMTNCVIERNTVSSTYAGGVWHRGGGVYIGGGAWTIRDCRISYNVASAPLSSGAGINLTGSATHSIKNCVFLQNASNKGSGITVENFNGPTLAVDNCSLVGNVGEGVYVESGATTLRNSILWQNGDDINGAMTLINCDVQDGDAGAGCISVNPNFERGLYLADGSLCIDAGSDTAVALGLDTYTTRAAGTLDSGAVDIGYHAFTGLTAATADLYVSPAGNDANSGTNLAEAFKTITKATSRIVEGSRIHVAAGTYDTSSPEVFPLVLNRFGVQLLGADAATTIINASGSNQRVVDMTDSMCGRIQGVTLCGGGKSSWPQYNGSGAGLLVANSIGTTVSGCVISNNVSGLNGGGLAISSATEVLVTDCSIAQNRVSTRNMDSEQMGGGVYSENSSGIISNCLVLDNQADGLSYPGNVNRTRGGGLALYNGAWKVYRSVFSRNSAGASFHDRADCYARGGGINILGGTHEFQNCVIGSNTLIKSAVNGKLGDGINVDSGTVQFQNLTVANNTHEGLRNSGGAVSITNSILWGNETDLVPDAGALTVAYCDIGVTAYGGGVNCISTDPLFVDAIYFHLQSRNGNYVGGYFSGGIWISSPFSSPCIDAGAPDSSYALEPAYNGRRINMGAYGNTEVASGTGSGTIFIIR